VASEARNYSDLYFDYGENSFAITPIGDLVRNYGPVGVPIGMFLFGIIIRFIYRALIEDQPQLIWRSTLYFMLLMAISYEGFYGLLIPFLFKVGVTAIVGLLMAGLIAKSLGHRRNLVSV
jgi:oligosaccharide repeat unit polymerase